MRPKPDHGEQSYQGCGRLAGRRALITGGDSGIGRAAAIAFAREGADIAFNYLRSEEPDAAEVTSLIRDAGRQGFPESVGTAASAFEKTRRRGRLPRETTPGRFYPGGASS